MKLFRLKRKNITLGALGVRRMFVAADDEHEARRVAFDYRPQLHGALDPAKVDCRLVAEGATGTRPHVVADYRADADKHTPPPSWVEKKDENKDK